MSLNPGSSNQQGTAVEVKATPQEWADLAAVSLGTRLPDFWTDQPRDWFIQVEAIMSPQHLSDLHKFNLVITKLGKDIIKNVTDVLANPPDTDKYATLKSRLLGIYEETQKRQVQKLFREMSLGDQRPSQLLRRMRELGKGKLEDEVILVLWLDHLPAAVRTVLATKETKDLDILADVADRAMDSLSPIFVDEIGHSAGTSRQSRASETICTVEMMMKEIAKLHLKMDKMGVDQKPRFGRNRSRSRNQRSRAGTPSTGRRTPANQDWLCFYHYRFKENAKKCVQPCNWQQKEN